MPVVTAIALFVALAPAGPDAPAPRRIAHDRTLGIGGMLGDPTGVSFKWFARPRHALSSSLGFGAFHLGGGRVDVSYLWHSQPWATTSDFELVGYLGVGIGVAFWASSYVGPFTPADFRQACFFFRAPVLGMAFHFVRLPMDLFIETAYSPLVGPPLTFWNVDFALGGRYYF